jgi:hypothetical protein
VTLGVNYPWRRYGGDFGPTVWGTDGGVRAHVAAVRADFAAMTAAGVQVVRWFVFTDARGGIAIDEAGWPAGLLPGAAEDLDALLGLAGEAGLQVVPVLFDHLLAFDATVVDGATLGGHARWLADPAGQARVLDTIVEPLAERYGVRGVQSRLGKAVLAWDLFNEPDWIVQEMDPSPRVQAPVPFDVMAAWVRGSAATIRRHEAGQITIGNARLRFARWWDDPRLGLDFLQAHTYYDPRHDFDLLQTSVAALGLSRPIVVGECSARGDAPDPARGRPALSLADLAAAARARGFAGIWPWSWRAADAHGGLDVADLATAHVAFQHTVPGTERRS